MIDEQQSLGTLSKTHISRRRILQHMGYGAAGLIGLDILAACGGSPVITNTPTPAPTVTTNLQPARQLAPYFLGYNNVPIHGPMWEDTNMVAAAKILKPGNLRYPGGTIANFWDWKKGWFLPNARPGFLTIPPVYYRLQELQMAVQATGAMPIYVVNMITSNINYQIDMLHAAKQMGLPVQFVELGNEFYLRSPENVQAFPTSQDYGKTCTTWISEIHKAFPDVKISAVATVPSKNTPRVREQWNDGLFQTLRGADAVTLHPYVQIKKGFIAKDVATTGPDAITTAQKIIGATFTKWQEVLQALQTIPSNLNLWFTEYNLSDGIGNLAHTWLQGLCAASITLTYLEAPQTSLACLYDMIGRSGFEAVYFDKRGAPGKHASVTQLQQYELTAVGYTMRLLANTIAGMNSAQQIAFNPNPLLMSDLPYSTSLQGWLFTDGARQSAYIINRSANAFTWQSGATFSQPVSYQQMAAGPLKAVTDASSFTTTSGTLQSQLLLPPFSVTQVKPAS